MPRKGVTGAPQISEADFQALIIDYAELRGWLVYHVPDSRKVQRTGKGFPDLVLARRGEVIIAELKTDKGELSKEQKEWFMLLKSAEIPEYSFEECLIRGMQVEIWRPKDWDMIEEMLR